MHENGSISCLLYAIFPGSTVNDCDLVYRFLLWRTCRKLQHQKGNHGQNDGSFWVQGCLSNSKYGGKTESGNHFKPWFDNRDWNFGLYIDYYFCGDSRFNQSDLGGKTQTEKRMVEIYPESIG